MTDHRVTMLGTGLIGLFYTMTLHGRRLPDGRRKLIVEDEASGRFADVLVDDEGP